MSPANREPVTARLEAISPTPDQGFVKRVSFLNISAFILGICALSWAVMVICAVQGQPIPATGWRTAAVATSVCSVMFVGALVRDYVDVRLACTETRAHGRLQAEVFRIEGRLDRLETSIERALGSLAQGQADIRQQTAMLRSELVALLGALPEGVINYGSGCATDAHLAALREFAATGTDGDTEPGIHPTPHLRSVGRHN